MIKKAFLFTLGLFVLIPAVFVNALTLDVASGLFDTETVIETKLLANPSRDDLNALSVRLEIEGGEFVDFVAETNPEWVGLTRDCNNSETFFTSTTVCLSLAKTTPIIKDEVLGTLKIKVSGIEQTKVVKVEGNKYTNGTDTIDDLGDLALYFTSASLQDAPDSFPVESVAVPDSTWLVIGLVILLAVGILAGGYLLLKRRGGVNFRKLSSSGKVIAVVAGFSVLGLSTLAIGTSLQNNQAPEESSAYIIECGSGDRACTSDGLSYKVCGTDGRYGSSSTYCGNGMACRGSGECYKLDTCSKVGDSECRKGVKYVCSTNYLWSSTSQSCSTGAGGGGDKGGDGGGSDVGGGDNNGGGNNQGGGNNNNGSGSNAAARKAICGESCNSDADCATSGFGVKVICNSNKKCASPACPNDTVAGTLCSCKTSASKCGDRCGIWSDGFQPLCGDGVSSCSWINGPSCGGNNKTYCLPNKVPAGYEKKACTNEKDAKGYKYIADSTGKVITDIEIIKQLCNPVVEKKLCYKCTVATNDGNACENTEVNKADACPSGYTENSNCALQAGGNCPVDQTVQLDPCGNMDSNGDGKLTVIDFASFAQVYNKSCSNQGFTANSCGSRDVNSDGKIDIIDFASFAARYEKPSCVILEQTQ